MMPRFRLPVSQEYAESCLAMAVAAEVESRGHSISPDGDFEQCVRQTAAWTVNASPRHSLLLAGQVAHGGGHVAELHHLARLRAQVVDGEQRCARHVVPFGDRRAVHLGERHGVVERHPHALSRHGVS